MLSYQVGRKISGGGHHRHLDHLAAGDLHALPGLPRSVAQQEIGHALPGAEQRRGETTPPFFSVFGNGLDHLALIKGGGGGGGPVSVGVAARRLGRPQPRLAHAGQVEAPGAGAAPPHLRPTHHPQLMTPSRTGPPASSCHRTCRFGQPEEASDWSIRGTKSHQGSLFFFKSDRNSALGLKGKPGNRQFNRVQVKFENPSTRLHPYSPYL